MKVYSYAFRPDGITWPLKEDGSPSFKLEQLTVANGLSHEKAHDAMSDVYATIAMAKLIKQQQPKLYDYYFNLRRKQAVSDQIDVLKMFQDDAGTEAILMMGEIGGTAEEEAAAYIQKYVTKPVAAFIAGQTAPPGKRMGHAGAIISGGMGSAQDKMAALRKAGILVAESPADLGITLQEALKRKKS